MPRRTTPAATLEHQPTPALGDLAEHGLALELERLKAELRRAAAEIESYRQLLRNVRNRRARATDSRPVFHGYRNSSQKEI